MMPKVVQELSYETILDELVAQTKELLPKWNPAEGDTAMLVLRAFAYRELHLRAYFNTLAKAFFLSTASGSDLDALAETLYGLYRLKGSKPRAKVKLSLLAPLPYEYRVPKGFRLSDESGEFFALLVEDVVFMPSEIEKEGVIELQMEIAFLDIKSEMQTTPMPYLKVKQLTPFENGSDKESDEEFRERIRVSLAHKSTAGSALTYKGFAYSADERIEDVRVVSPSPGVVHVIYWAQTMDDAMRERVWNTLSAEDVRPLTDNLEIFAANEVRFDVEARLKISTKSDSAKVYVRALENLQRVFAKTKIGEDISQARVIDALMVEGVRDVQLNKPDGNIKIDDYSIALLGNVSVSYEVGDEL